MSRRCSTQCVVELGADSLLSSLQYSFRAAIGHAINIISCHEVAHKLNHVIRFHGDKCKSIKMSISTDESIHNLIPEVPPLEKKPPRLVHMSKALTYEISVHA